MVGFLWCKVNSFHIFFRTVLRKQRGLGIGLYFSSLKNSDRSIQRCGVFRNSSTRKGFFPCNFKLYEILDNFVLKGKTAFVFVPNSLMILPNNNNKRLSNLSSVW